MAALGPLLNLGVENAKLGAVVDFAGDVDQEVARIFFLACPAWYKDRFAAEGSGFEGKGLLRPRLHIEFSYGSGSELIEAFLLQNCDVTEPIGLSRSLVRYARKLDGIWAEPLLAKAPRFEVETPSKEKGAPSRAPGLNTCVFEQTSMTSSEPSSKAFIA